MKTICFILCITLLSSLAFAQSPEIEWGPITEYSKGEYNNRVIGHDADGFYVLKTTGNYTIDNGNIFLDYYASLNYEYETSVQVFLPTVDGMFSEFLDLFY